MEIGTSTRIVGLPAIGDVRPVPPSPPDATRTELPRDAAVQQPQAPVRTEPEPQAARTVAVGDNLKRQHTLDIATHKVIYEAIDQRTGQVVYQVPDLRYLKAYADQQKATSGDGAEASGVQLERVA